MENLLVIVVDGILEAERPFSGFNTVVRREETYLEVIAIDGAFVGEAKLKYTWTKYTYREIMYSPQLFALSFVGTFNLVDFNDI